MAGTAQDAARYLPQPAQIPVALGFIAAGALAFWWAARLGRGAGVVVRS
jgi:hypothetical protein